MTDEPAAIGHNSQPESGAALRGFVQRIERVQVDIDEHREDRKELYAEAKSGGFDVKILRKIIARRRRRSTDVEAEEALIETYLAAIGVLD